MVQPEHEELSVRQQCALLHLARSNLYYEPVEVGAEELALMRDIDRLYLEHPYYGSRRMAVALGQQGLLINRKRVQRLMRFMGLEGMAPGPSTSRPRSENPRFPYLLRNLQIIRPDQVWASDITYVPLERGWAYLVVIMDWFSRAVLAFRLSNTMGVEFCLEALEEALGHWGPPEIFNTDQGAQFTSIEWVAMLLAHEVRVSMDGKGRWMDNVFVERLWRSLKYETVYPRAYSNVHEAWAGIRRWLHFYNHRRPHQALGYRTPMEVYRTGVLPLAA